MGKRTRRTDKPPNDEKVGSASASGLFDNPDLFGLYQAFAPLTLLSGGPTDQSRASTDPSCGGSGEGSTELLHRIQAHFVEQQRQFLAIAAELLDDDSIAKRKEPFDPVSDPEKDSAPSESDRSPHESQIPSMLAAWQAAVQQLSGIGSDRSNLRTPSPDFTPLSDGAPDLVRNMMQLGSMGDIADANVAFSRLAGSVDNLRSVQERLYALGNDIASESMSALKKRLAEKEDAPVTSARELYDLWVDCSEAVYADRVQKDEYAVLYGELVNAAVEARQHRDAVIELVSGLFGLPRRTYFESIEKELLDARRQEKAARKERRALRAQIDALTDKVETLSRGAPESKKSAGKRRGKKKREPAQPRSKNR